MSATTPEVLERLERWRGGLKTAYCWSERDDECYVAAVGRLRAMDTAVAALDGAPESLHELRKAVEAFMGE